MWRVLLGSIFLTDWTAGVFGTMLTCQKHLEFPSGIERACCAPNHNQIAYDNAYPDAGLCPSSNCQVFGYKNSARANCVKGSTTGRCAYCECAAAIETCPTTKETPNGNVHCYGTVKTVVGAPAECPLAPKANNPNPVYCVYDGNSLNFKICTDVETDDCPNGECPAYAEYNEDPLVKDCECIRLVPTNQQPVTYVRYQDVTSYVDDTTKLVAKEWGTVLPLVPGTGILPADFRGGFSELMLTDEKGSCDDGVCICLACPPNSIWYPPYSKLPDRYLGKYSENGFAGSHGICICDDDPTKPLEEQYVPVSITGEPLVCRPQEEGCGSDTSKPCLAMSPGFIPIYKNFRRRSHVMIGKINVEQVATTLANKLAVQLTFELFSPEYFEDTEDMLYRRGPRHEPKVPHTPKKARLGDWELSFRKIEFWISTTERVNNGWGKAPYKVTFPRPAIIEGTVTANRTYKWDPITLDYSCESSMSGALWLTARVQAYGGKQGHGNQHGYTDVLFSDRDHYKHDTSIPITCLANGCPGLCDLTCDAFTECKYTALGGSYCGCKEGYFSDNTVATEDNTTINCVGVDQCEGDTAGVTVCPDHSSCSSVGGGVSCTCDENRIYYSPDSECALPYPVVGITRLGKINNDGTCTFVGTVSLDIKIPNTGDFMGIPQFGLKITMDAGYTIVALGYALTSRRLPSHSSYSVLHCGVVGFPCDGSAFNTAYRTVQDPATLQPLVLDCLDDFTSVFVSLWVTYKATAGGASAQAWAYGGSIAKDGDDFEAQIMCVDAAPTDGAISDYMDMLKTCIANGKGVLAVNPNSGNIECVCILGFTSNSDGQTNCVQDIDECTINPTICGPADTTLCTNTPGSFVCGCKTKSLTYSPDGCYRAAETKAVAGAPAEGTSGPATWNLIIIGVLGAALAAAIVLNVVQFVLAKRREEAPYFASEIMGELDPSFPVPPPSTNTGFASPHALRYRSTSKNSTPKAADGDPSICH